VKGNKGKEASPQFTFLATPLAFNELLL